MDFFLSFVLYAGQQILNNRVNNLPRYLTSRATKYYLSSIKPYSTPDLTVPLALKQLTKGFLRPLSIGLNPNNKHLGMASKTER